MASVPEEIIEENILTRLPVKSISRFRCVSKNWYILFRNPNFIRKHLHHAALLNNFNILVTNDDPDIPRTEAFLYSIDNNVLSSSLSSQFSAHTLKIHYPLMFRESKPRVLGSCNGLVCIEPFYDNICIWNPATGEYKRVPEHSPDSHHFVFDTHGFGFDCKNYDYKVLKIGRTWEGENTEARIYSLASNSWKSLGSVPYDFSCSKQKGLLHNGVLHWMVRGLESWVTVCFDISDETFHELPLPNIDERFMSQLGIWGGNLCLLHTNHVEDHVMCTHENDHIDVFTIIDNKWIKHMKIQITDMSYRRAIQTLQNGEILFERRPRGEKGFGLMSYDPNLERARALKIYGFPDMLLPGVETYIETLVTLNTGTYVGQFWGEESTCDGVVGLQGKQGELEKLKAQKAELEAQLAVLMFRQLPQIDGRR